MSEFKFNCPACGQHLKAEPSVVGSQISCPTCQATITIPSPEEAARAEAEASPFQPPPEPPVAPAARFPTRALPTPGKPGEPADPKSPQTQISKLTPEIKLAIVRSVRRRIADETNWLPRRNEAGEYAYAAKVVDGKNVPIEVNSPEATRYSLLGAILLEFQERNVTQMALGRRELLDSDILEALKEVLQAEKGEPFKGEIKEVVVTHPESLGILDVLEKRYDAAMRQTRGDAAEGKLDSIRMEDVVKRLESKSGLTPEDVATAVFFELEDIKRRLLELERAGAPKA